MRSLRWDDNEHCWGRSLARYGTRSRIQLSSVRWPLRVVFQIEKETEYSTMARRVCVAVQTNEQIIQKMARISDISLV